MGREPDLEPCFSADLPLDYRDIGKAEFLVCDQLVELLMGRHNHPGQGKCPADIVMHNDATSPGFDEVLFGVVPDNDISSSRLAGEQGLAQPDENELSLNNRRDVSGSRLFGMPFQCGNAPVGRSNELQQGSLVNCH